MPHRIRAPRASLAAALLALLGLPSGGCRSSHAAPAPAADPAVPVRTAAVDRGPVRRPVRAAGAVAAKDERDLAFKLGGLVARVEVHAGDAVRRGQVLAALDVTEVAAVARQAREALAKAERDLARARLLRSGDAVPPAAVQDAETGVAVARAAVEGAEFNLRNAVLVAPDDGWVDRRLAEPGEVVAPGRPILRVSGRGRGFVVRAHLAERDVLDVAPGGAATVWLDARPGEPIPGRVAEVARSAAPGTGTYQVEVRLDPARGPRALLSGLTAKLEIDRAVAGAAAVPLSALLDGDGARGAVFVVDGARARRVPVEVAFLQGDRAVLSAGLDGVERVVTDGATRLADGAAVRLLP